MYVETLLSDYPRAKMASKSGCFVCLFFGGAYTKLKVFYILEHFRFHIEIESHLVILVFFKRINMFSYRVVSKLYCEKT